MSKDNNKQDIPEAEDSQAEALPAASGPQPPETQAASGNKQADAAATEKKPVDNKDKTAEPATDGKQGPSQTPGPATATSKNKSGRGLAGFALVVALASLGLSGWQYQQSRPHTASSESTVAPGESPALDSTSQLQALQEQLQEQLASQTQELALLKQQLGELPNSKTFDEQQRTLRQMQSAHQAFSMRFEAAFGNTRQDWRLAEAEHLLRMAILRLDAMQDLASAKQLVEGADQILFEQDDVAAYPAREAIAQALADIQAMPKLDRVGLFVRLGALQQHIRQLDQLIPGFEASSITEKVTDGAFWREWLDELSSYVRLDFNSPDDLQPLLSSQEVTHIRLAVSLAVEQAQWSALNGQQQAFNQAIEQGINLIRHYFSSENQSAQALLNQLEELAGQSVSQDMPDIKPALLALQAYIADRTLEYRTRSEEQQ